MEKALKTPKLEPQLPSTVEGCHDFICGLLNTVSELFNRIEKLENANKKLLQENKELKDRLKINSSNSSLSPSKYLKKKKKAKKVFKNKSGGQKGHPGHFRELLDSIEVDSIVKCNLPDKKEWMWSIASSTIAFFSIMNSRGKKVLKSLMADYRYVVTSDRYAAYNYFDSDKRQICWAHLKRDFTRLSEKEDKVCSRIGKSLLQCEAGLFKNWYEFKQSKITRDELLRKSQPIRQRVGELLEQGSYTDPLLKIARFCKNLLDIFNALWTFLSVEQIEPTNNHAERCLRPIVTWRKKYFGTRSDYDSEFVARTASIRMTCQLQSKNTFQFLQLILQSYFDKKQTPSLLLMA